MSGTVSHLPRHWASVAVATRSETWQNVMSGVLAICAMIAVGIMVFRRGPPPPPPTSAPPAPVDDWASLAAVGHRIGPVNAAVTILEFGDFECPACGSYHKTTLQPFLQANAMTTALVFRHWPLPYHRFAMPAARASECAARQGAFPAYHKELCGHQDSLGLRSFGQVAVAAGVRDTMAFAECLAEPDEPAAIAVDVKAITELGGTGTPTILVNGYQWFGLPTRVQLDSILKVSRAGSAVSK